MGYNAKHFEPVSRDYISLRVLSILKHLCRTGAALKLQFPVLHRWRKHTCMHSQILQTQILLLTHALMYNILKGTPFKAQKVTDADYCDLAVLFLATLMSVELMF